MGTVFEGIDESLAADRAEKHAMSLDGLPTLLAE